MPQRVQRGTLDLDALGNALPCLRKALVGPAIVTVAKDGFTFAVARQAGQQIGSGLPQRAQAIALFGFGKTKLPCMQIHLTPSQAGHLSAPIYLSARQFASLPECLCL